MNKLTFEWIAIFKDGSKLQQYDNDKENLFKEVQQRFKDLVYFNLTDKKGHLFTVDLINGRIGYNYLILPYMEVEYKNNPRLVYFRRHKIEISTQDLKEVSHIITYNLGFQWNNNLGKNQKIILKIDEQGNFIITNN